MLIVHSLTGPKTRLPLVAVLLYIAAGCQTARIGPVVRRDACYFKSAEEAVAVINRLLKNEDWATLGCYYDLTGTSIDRSMVQSRAFYIRDDRPSVAHPAGFWKYKQPFPLGFTYKGRRPTADTSIIQVDVNIDVAEGGGMVQRAFDSFQLRASKGGFQLLPKT